jgi:DNA-binding HxlR family transcriptional regulator
MMFIIAVRVGFKQNRRHLDGRNCSFFDLHHAIDEISQKMLLEQLDDLRVYGVIDKRRMMDVLSE